MKWKGKLRLKNLKNLSFYLSSDELKWVAEYVFKELIQFYEKSVDEMPGIPVFYISISPTKARWDVWAEANTVNQLIKKYAEGNARISV